MRQPSAGELVSSIKAFIYEQSKQSSRQLLVSEYERYRWLARIVQLDVFFSFRTRARALSVLKVGPHSRGAGKGGGLTAAAPAPPAAPPACQRAGVHAATRPGVTDKNRRNASARARPTATAEPTVRGVAVR